MALRGSRRKCDPIEMNAPASRTKAGRPYVTIWKSQKLSMLMLCIHDGRTHSFMPMPNTGCLRAFS